MKIVYLDPDNSVREILPEATYEKGAAFWYGPEFAERCVEAPDDVEQGYVYNAETGIFSKPSYNVPAPEPETEPSVWDELDAAYTEGVNAAYDQ